jgi:hypothetical protein
MNRNPNPKIEEKKESLTINPLTVRAAEESHHPGNVRGDGASTQRTQIGDSLLDVLHAGAWVGTGGVMPRIRAEHVGLDASRGDGVDGDSLGAGVGGEGAREAFDGGFGAGVERMIGHAGHGGGDGGHEDYTAAACCRRSV